MLVFGTFDGLHSGHKFFLQTARSLGTRLIVSVARDAHVVKLKNKSTNFTEQKRLAFIKQIKGVDEVVLSDETLGTFSIILRTQPDLIVLGYDQNELEKSLIEWMKKNGQRVAIKKLSEMKLA